MDIHALQSEKPIPTTLSVKIAYASKYMASRSHFSSYALQGTGLVTFFLNEKVSLLGLFQIEFRDHGAR